MLLLLWYVYVFILYSVGVLNSTSELIHNLHKEFIYLLIFESACTFQFCLPDLSSKVQEYLNVKKTS